MSETDLQKNIRYLESLECDLIARPCPWKANGATEERCFDTENRRAKGAYSRMKPEAMCPECAASWHLSMALVALRRARIEEQAAL